MEDPKRRLLTLQLRKAEEAASRRSQATQWLEKLVGPLGISSQPTEREFISCLQTGLVLCNAINKIQQGSVSKVVENHSPSETQIWDSQLLPAYQYFENIRNFLVAVADLKLQPFDSSIFERDNLEVGSSSKVVDCIMEIKAYDEWKKRSGGMGFYKQQKSPLNAYLAATVHPQSSAIRAFETRRRLNMSAGPDTSQSDTIEIEDSLVKALAESMIKEKENVDNNLITSFRNGNANAAKSLSKILSSCLDEQLQNKSLEDKPILMNILAEEHTSLEDSSSFGNLKCCRACVQKGHCNHWQLFEVQEIELLNLKSLLSRTKKEFEDLQSQLQNDLRQLGYHVGEMSTAALGYHKVVKENMNLYNVVQDLKGNIRDCRIRPTFEDARVISFIQEDNGSLVIFDPLKPQKEGKKFFQFDHVFTPTTTQDDVFRDIKPLIRSVMDGYDVCIFAYGQTGSGKTYTMYGSAKEIGINNQAIDYLFELSNRRTNILEYQIYVQMVEIYNEQVRDLLAQCSSAKEYSSETFQATMRLVKFSGDVINLMNGYERTSCSHCILTVHVQSKDASGNIHRSRLHLVDLAGSERVDRYQDTENGFIESQFINKSFSCLGDLLTALARKNACIPYRNDKLNLLLQMTLGGHAKMLMIAHVRPEEDCFGESLATLNFTQKLSNFELGAPGPNKDSTEAMELKEQIVSLKRALAKNEAAEKSAQIKPKETKSPVTKTKSAISDKSSPHSRRLSIENYSNSIMDTEKKPPNSAIPDKTPPCFRRLSTENGSNNITKTEKKLLNSAIPDKTPPRPRRVDNFIGNSIMHTEKKTTKHRDKKPSNHNPISYSKI